mmetsp:Transcript_42313/g.74197  ORF Transcript_42313/g.74197 Transcript_42313/m.74197 type:complete len:833 (-) Transcript_42313:144-2642(-)
MVPRSRHLPVTLHSPPLPLLSTALQLLGATCLLAVSAAAAGELQPGLPQDGGAGRSLCAHPDVFGDEACPETTSMAMLQRTVLHSQVAGLQDDRATDIASVGEEPSSMLLERGTAGTGMQFTESSSTTMSNDLTDLLSSLVFNGAIIVCHIAFFCLIRVRHPLIYSNNAVIGKAPFEPDNTLFGWVLDSRRLTVDEIIRYAGLDCGMLVEFINFGSRVMLIIGLPMILIMCPLHYLFGGAGVIDPLSKLDMANVADKSWLYWIHAGIVWGVVIFVDRTIFSVQTKFMKRRSEWLRSMPPPRCTTAFVQNIPLEHRSDEKLKKYFNHLLMHDAVESAYVVRRPSEFLSMQTQLLEKNRLKLSRAEIRWSKTGRNPDKRPKHREVRQTGNDNNDHYSREVTHDEVDSIDYYEEAVKSGEETIKAERERMESAAAEGNPSVFVPDGFVTFKQRHDTEMAMSAIASDDEFVMCIPPDPADVRFSVLEQDRSNQARDALMGYFFIMVLFFSYLPVIVAISLVTSLDTLRHASVAFETIVIKYPQIASLWDGLVGSCALTLFMSFVPTFMMVIMRGCFNLPAETWCQHQLQHWYFYFQVTFVLLIFCIGNSLFSTYLKLVKNPTRAFGLLASTLPQAAHFYLNFFPLQWVAHTSHLCRYINIVKFWFYSRSYPEAKAREFSEPEDQDYYGMGARSARFSLLFVTALVFCTISPIICLLFLVDFQLCRTFYGYLLVFAECRKTDTGGCFWITQMKHVQHGMFLYVTLMVGIFCERAGAYGPGLVAAFSYLYLVASYRKFDQQFKWVRLPLEETVKLDISGVKPDPVGTYAQVDLGSRFA